jgi:hypothetical protein
VAAPAAPVAAAPAPAPVMEGATAPAQGKAASNVKQEVVPPTMEKPTDAVAAAAAAAEQLAEHVTYGCKGRPRVKMTHRSFTHLSRSFCT